MDAMIAITAGVMAYVSYVMYIAIKGVPSWKTRDKP